MLGGLGEESKQNILYTCIKLSKNKTNHLKSSNGISLEFYKTLKKELIQIPQTVPSIGRKDITNPFYKAGIILIPKHEQLSGKTNKE